MWPNPGVDEAIAVIEIGVDLLSQLLDAKATADWLGPKPSAATLPWHAISQLALPL